jgi:hypothetical protein
MLNEGATSAVKGACSQRKVPILRHKAEQVEPLAERMY